MINVFEHIVFVESYTPHQKKNPPSCLHSLNTFQVSSYQTEQYKHLQNISWTTYIYNGVKQLLQFTCETSFSLALWDVLHPLDYPNKDLWNVNKFCSILLPYCMLCYSILFHSILFCSVLFYAILLGDYEKLIWSSRKWAWPIFKYYIITKMRRIGNCLRLHFRKQTCPTESDSAIS